MKVDPAPAPSSGQDLVIPDNDPYSPIELLANRGTAKSDDGSKDGDMM